MANALQQRYRQIQSYTNNLFIDMGVAKVQGTMSDLDFNQTHINALEINSVLPQNRTQYVPFYSFLVKIPISILLSETSLIRPTEFYSYVKMAKLKTILFRIIIRMTMNVNFMA